MLSLKYKNLVKTTLMEGLTEEDVAKNKAVLSQFLEAIKYFPFFRISNHAEDAASVKIENNSLYLYINTSVGEFHLYKGKKLLPGEVDIQAPDFNPNKPYFYQYYNFTIFSLENHLGVLSWNHSKERYRYLYNTDSKNDNLFDNYQFNKNFDGRLSKEQVKPYIEDYVRGVIKELNKMPIKKSNTIKPQEKKVKVEKPKSSSKLNADEVIQTLNDPNLRVYSEDEAKQKFTETDDAVSQAQKRKGDVFHTDKGKLRLTATRLIGDDNFRNIDTLRRKVEASLTDFNKMESDPTELLASNVLYWEMENISNGGGSNKVDFKEKDINSADSNIHNALLYLSTDPNEIISPIAVLKMDNITWSTDANGESAKKEIQKVFGDKSAFNNGLISFPQTTNAPLVDSYALITYKGQSKLLGISTKGGLNGKGANASLSSLFKFLLKDDTTYKMNKWGYNKSFADRILTVCKEGGNVQETVKELIGPHLSLTGQYFWSSDKKDLLTLLLLFGGIPMSYHSAIINYAVKYGIGKMKFHNTDPSSFASEASVKGLTDLVMELLDKQKYKFCQVNTKPSLTKDSFNYQISVQYPAKFSGTVSFKKAPSETGLRFHISGD